MSQDIVGQSNIDLFLRSLHTSRNYMFKTSCIGRESNPGLPRGRREFYHWTTNALEYGDKAGNRIIKLHLQAYFSICGLRYIFHPKKKAVLSPRRGIEPRSPAWQAGILTTILTRSWCVGPLKKRGALVLTISLQCWALTLLTKTSV